MTDTPEKHIRIKLEIEIPVSSELGIGKPKIVTQSLSDSPLRPLAVGINKPNGGARCLWQGASGLVCASGTATYDGQVANSVQVGVFPGDFSPGSVPPPGTMSVPVSPDGAWGNIEVGGVQGYPDPYEQTFACWATFPEGMILSSLSRFFPVWSFSTACRDYPSQVSVPAPASSTAFDLLPASWKSRIRGFSGVPMSRLNGEWILRLVSPSTFPIIYCNGGDGIKEPRIQLLCDCEASKFWELTLKAGGCQITYSCPADQFEGIGRNIFQNANSIGLSEDIGIPALISISPA